MYIIQPTPLFDNAKNKLKKKYHNIDNDYKALIEHLKQGVFQGDKLQGFPDDTYKVRVASTDQKKGKRGGFRIIYYVVTNDTVYLLTIYAKAKQTDLTEEQKNKLKEYIELLAQK